MVIGEQAQDNVGLMKRYVREGHEIGNHTFTHPDISEISDRQLELELNLTERLFGSKLGVQPLYFRPPYSIDQEPDTNDQAAPADRIQQMGYTIIGNKIDTDDWNEHPRKTPQEITDNVLAQLAVMKDKPWFRGSIILMHDGGGDRSATVAALPLLITTLRAKGYEFVPVSELMGKTTAEVMPPISPQMRWQARIDSVAFFFLSFFSHFVVDVFFLGDVLMSARLILVGILALIDRLRRRRVPPGEYAPRVAVLIPAYNEETVIVRTIRSVLNSDYPQHPRHCDRRRIDGRHLRGGARSLSGGDCHRQADRADEAECGQSGGAQLRPAASGRRDLCRHRRRHGDRAGCGLEAGMSILPMSEWAPWPATPRSATA